ncbi:MAG: DUF1127 domain-containing protein [Pseudomonadota bacterium]
MAQSASNTVLGRGLPILGSISAGIQTLRERYAKYRVYANTLNELRSLSPRERADLGLDGSMLTQIAHEAAYGK